jgi:hypothetical protein
MRGLVSITFSRYTAQYGGEALWAACASPEL